MSETFEFEAEAPQFKLHPEEEWIEGTLVSREFQASTKAGFDDQYKWVLHLDGDVDGDGKQRETWHYTGVKLTTHAKNKLRKLLKGVTGADPAVGEKVNLTLPARVKVMFENKPPAADGTVRQHITNIKAL